MKTLAVLCAFLCFFAVSAFASDDMGASDCPAGYTCMKPEDCSPDLYIKLENQTCGDNGVCCKLKDEGSKESKE
jgi:hypothetical protein